MEVNNKRNEEATQITETGSQRKRQTKDANKEVRRCNIKSDPARRNDKERVRNIWQENNYPLLMEERLADQIQA